MKALVFDSGPIISMALTNTLWILEPLKKKFGGRFVITPAVQYEIVDRPLKSKRFKYEALQVMKLIEKGILEVVTPKEISSLTATLLESANSIFCAKNKCIPIVHKGEVESIAAAVVMSASAVVVDERTTRMLIERPPQVRKVLEKKNHFPIAVQHQFMRRWKEHTFGLHVIRSTELASMAYELGIFDSHIPNVSRKEFVDGLLWALRLNGCSISSKEITRIPKLLGATS